MDLSAYPSAIHPLLSGDRVPELGPGKPNATARPILATLTAETLFGDRLRRAELAQCCLAALWLLHDFLDEAHTISQDIDGAEGSYWHAIMHRREPDAANAGYWFRRVGAHPIFAMLATAASELGYQADTTRWDPFAFIAMCEKYRDTGTAEEMRLRRVQQREWELLFGWCHTRAVEAG